jgi:hypothetical protein
MCIHVQCRVATEEKIFWLENADQNNSLHELCRETITPLSFCDVGPDTLIP